MSKIKSVQVDDSVVTISLTDGMTLNILDFWLRDNCRCDGCYNYDTFQRSHHILDIPEVKVKAAEVRSDTSKTEQQLFIKWSDNHESTYTTEFLKQYHYSVWLKQYTRPVTLWRGDQVAEAVARVDVKAFLETRKGAVEVFKSLLDFGVAFVEGVSADLKGTEQVCEHLGGVQRTLFGGMWQFTSQADHADTAYTTLSLAPHNDSTYFSESTGLQILHCVEHVSGSGGDTVLVDGFYGASRLQKISPEHFNFLSSHVGEAEYLEEGHHHKHAGRVINLDPVTGELQQIRFNVYDRSLVAFKDSEECRVYYAALKAISSIYQDKDNQWWFKLNPGTVLVMDNWRVLHGRSSFTGKRVLCGSYVTRSDWRDRARVLGLLS